jgi:hypothetical protein
MGGATKHGEKQKNMGKNNEIVGPSWPQFVEE